MTTQPDRRRWRLLRGDENVLGGDVGRYNVHLISRTPLADQPAWQLFDQLGQTCHCEGGLRIVLVDDGLSAEETP